MWEPVALCCFTKRTGCLVLGSLEVIGAILGFITATILYALIETRMDVLCMQINAFRWGTVDCDNMQQQQAPTFVYCILVVWMILCVIQCICSSMMIHGVRTNNHCLMAPFLIKNLILIVLYIIICSIAVAFLCAVQFYLMIPFAYCHGAIIFMNTYFLLTVKAYYSELKRGKADDHHRLVENCHLEHGQTNKL